jgi:hypothetical protein
MGGFILVVLVPILGRICLTKPQQLNLNVIYVDPLGILPKGDAADPSNLALDMDSRRASPKKHIAFLGSKLSMDSDFRPNKLHSRARSIISLGE